MFLKIGVLKNFANFTGKHMSQPWPATILKKRLQYRCFHVKFAKFFRTLFYKTPPVAVSEI